MPAQVSPNAAGWARAYSPRTEIGLRHRIRSPYNPRLGAKRAAWFGRHLQQMRAASLRWWRSAAGPDHPKPRNAKNSHINKRPPLLLVAAAGRRALPSRQCSCQFELHVSGTRLACGFSAQAAACRRLLMTATVCAQAELGASVRGRHSLGPINNGKNVGHGRQRVFCGRAATTPPLSVCRNTPIVRALRLVGGRASLARCSGTTPPRKGTERRVPLHASELALMWLHNLLTFTRPLHSVCVSRRECALPRLALIANCRQRTTCAASVTVHSKPRTGEAIPPAHTGCRRWPRLVDARYACWQWRVRACLDVVQSESRHGTCTTLPLE
jgi:hypothetical protein